MDFEGDVFKHIGLSKAQVKQRIARPGETAAATAATAASSSAATKTAHKTTSSSTRKGGVKQPRTCGQKCRLYARILCMPRVLFQLASLLILPLALLAAISYWYFWIYNAKSMLIALLQDDIAAVRYQLESLNFGVDDVLPNDSYNRSALHFAAISNHTRLVKLLVSRGASVNIKDGNEWTPLFYAVESGNVATVDYLIEMGADVDARDDYDRTPLHIAGLTGSVPAAGALILNGGARLLLVDQDNRRALDYSNAMHKGGISQLIENGFYYDEDGDLVVLSSAQVKEVQSQGRISKPNWRTQTVTAPPAEHSSQQPLQPGDIARRAKKNLEIQKKRKRLTISSQSSKQTNKQAQKKERRKSLEEWLDIDNPKKNAPKQKHTQGGEDDQDDEEEDFENEDEIPDHLMVVE